MTNKTDETAAVDYSFPYDQLFDCKGFSADHFISSLLMKNKVFNENPKCCIEYKYWINIRFESTLICVKMDEPQCEFAKRQLEAGIYRKCMLKQLAKLVKGVYSRSESSWLHIQLESAMHQTIFNNTEEIYILLSEIKNSYEKIKFEIIERQKMPVYQEVVHTLKIEENLKSNITIETVKKEKINKEPFFEVIQKEEPKQEFSSVKEEKQPVLTSFMNERRIIANKLTENALTDEVEVINKNANYPYRDYGVRIVKPICIKCEAERQFAKYSKQLDETRIDIKKEEKKEECIKDKKEECKVEKDKIRQIIAESKYIAEQMKKDWNSIRFAQVDNSFEHSVDILTQIEKKLKRK